MHSVLILSSSQFLLMPQQPLKLTLAIKLVNIDSKIIISLPWSKSVNQIVSTTATTLESTKKVANIFSCEFVSIWASLWENRILPALNELLMAFYLFMSCLEFFKLISRHRHISLSLFFTQSFFGFPLFFFSTDFPDSHISILFPLSCLVSFFLVSIFLIKNLSIFPHSYLISSYFWIEFFSTKMYINVQRNIKTIIITSKVIWKLFVQICIFAHFEGEKSCLLSKT